MDALPAPPPAILINASIPQTKRVEDRAFLSRGCGGIATTSLEMAREHQPFAVNVAGENSPALEAKCPL